MKAEIMGIGTELLMGELNDTNAGWIATRLPPLGITLQWVTLVGDDLTQLTHAFQQGLKRSDIIFTTGGLGPTQDDLTREAVAATFGETPTVQEDMVEQLRQYFRSRGQDMPSHNIKQAWLIPSAQFIPNRNGTAPGWWAERDGKHVIIMPGPPVEMQVILREQVEPRLRELVTGEVTITRNVKTMGLGEAAVDEIMSEYFGQENPYLGIYSKADGIHLRVIARAADEAAARRMIAPTERAIKERLGEYVWGYDDETPEQAVAQALQSRGKTLAAMEYCTGGFLTNAITDVNEAQRHFRGGIVAFGAESLAAAGVPPALMDNHGAVSQETANAMASAALVQLDADYGIGVTGAPGPGELDGRPMGLCYLAIARAATAGPQVIKELELRVPPRRITIKRRISNQALIELRKLLEAGE
jgi:nicotinamide-nucleotide amidase